MIGGIADEIPNNDMCTYILLFRLPTGKGPQEILMYCIPLMTTSLFRIRFITTTHVRFFFSLLKCIIVITLVLFYSFSDVHFLPNGYLNGKTVRVSFLGNSKFSFLDEDLLRTWYQKLYFENTQISPKAILDVGTGTGGSAFVLGELLPKANIMVSTYSIMFSILHYYIMLNT